MYKLEIYHNPAMGEHTIYQKTPGDRGSITTTYPTYSAMIDDLVREFKDTDHKLEIEGAIPNRTDWGNFDVRKVKPLPEIQVKELCETLEILL